MLQVPVYSDLNQSLSSEYLYNVESIKQSIKNILTTRKGTRLFNADFGSDLWKYLFEIMDNATSFALMNEIIIAINKWEPRVIVVPEKSSIQADYVNGIYWLNLAFKIKSNPTDIHNFELGIAK